VSVLLLVVIVLVVLLLYCKFSNNMLKYKSFKMTMDTKVN